MNYRGLVILTFFTLLQAGGHSQINFLDTIDHCIKETSRNAGIDVLAELDKFTFDLQSRKLLNEDNFEELINRLLDNEPLERSYENLILEKLIFDNNDLCFQELHFGVNEGPNSNLYLFQQAKSKAANRTITEAKKHLLRLMKKYLIPELQNHVVYKHTMLFYLYITVPHINDPMLQKLLPPNKK